MTNIEVLDLFVPSYLETALWSSTNDVGEPLDTLYDYRTDVSSELCLRVVEDCCGFLMKAKPYLRNDVDFGHVAHDFWLTRNRHGFNVKIEKIKKKTK